MILLAQPRAGATEVSLLDVTEARALIKKPRSGGREEGRREGRAPVLHQFARRIGRALTEAEREVIATRLDALGADRLGEVVLGLDAHALAAWLADADAR